jgi:hypothetical protein
MLEFGTLTVTVVALSLTVTKVVDFFRNVFDKEDTRPKWLWNVAALVVGLAFAIGWEVNVAQAAASLVPALAEHGEQVNGVLGEVLTGFVIGMGAGFWHEALDALSSIANKNNATVPVAISE